jgi:hypothetical protein
VIRLCPLRTERAQKEPRVSPPPQSSTHEFGTWRQLRPPRNKSVGRETASHKDRESVARQCERKGRDTPGRPHHACAGVMAQASLARPAPVTKVAVQPLASPRGISMIKPYSCKARPWLTTVPPSFVPSSRRLIVASSLVPPVPTMTCGERPSSKLRICGKISLVRG